ncbi:NAD-binding protein [Streptomyces sp. NPDC058045]|uniref:potassium channel family protein n=1 Tax=Streptomyces sp. NPDC058045 TaxID=3346311 RepID=UPI0036EB8643
MVVCGDDALAHRLADELRTVYRENVTLVVPPAGRLDRRTQTGRGRAAVLLGRVTAAVSRAAGSTDTLAPPSPGRTLEAADLTEEVLAEVGVADAVALALVHDDDETNIRAALAARRLNPRLRLVIRLYNRRLGQHLASLLDQAAALAGRLPDGLDASTTVLSDADTAAPALAASALGGTSKVVRADGLLLRASELGPQRPGETREPGLCTLALLSATDSDPAGAEGSEDSGSEAPRLLPDEATVADARGRGTVVLKAVSYSGPQRRNLRSAPLSWLLLSRRLRWSFTGLVALVLALAVASMLTTGDRSTVHAVYLTVLDLFAINDPAVGEPAARQVLQLLNGLVGLLLLPVLLAAVLEVLGTFRSGAPRRPPRSLSGHVVLLGLGKIGSRVLVQLRELGIPVVCVEADPEARGMALARRLRVPVVIGDVTEEGVLEAAKIHRAQSLLALTSADATNLEAALYARSVKPGLRAVLRLYDDEFATAVYRTLRAAHPRALTRSRSVSHLAAPSFAVAMMGRQILGAIPVERRVLLFAAVDVAGHPLLEGHTVAEVFRPGKWRVIALDTAEPSQRRPDLGGDPGLPEDEQPGTAATEAHGLTWDLHPGYVLRPTDRVVLAATRRGLAELLGRHRGFHTP